MCERVRAPHTISSGQIGHLDAVHDRHVGGGVAAALAVFTVCTRRVIGGGGSARAWHPLHHTRGEGDANMQEQIMCICDCKWAMNISDCKWIMSVCDYMSCLRTPGNWRGRGTDRIIGTCVRVRVDVHVVDLGV